MLFNFLQLTKSVNTCFCFHLARFMVTILWQAAATTAALAKKYGADITVVGMLLFSFLLFYVWQYKKQRNFVVEIRLL